MGDTLATSGSDVFTLPRLTIDRTTTMERFGAIVNGQNTLTMRLDRALSRAHAVVRRAKVGLRIA